MDRIELTDEGVRGEFGTLKRMHQWDEVRGASVGRRSAGGRRLFLVEWDGRTYDLTSKEREWPLPRRYSSQQLALPGRADQRPGPGLRIGSRLLRRRFVPWIDVRGIVPSTGFGRGGNGPHILIGRTDSIALDGSGRRVDQPPAPRSLDDDDRPHGVPAGRRRTQTGVAARNTFVT